MNDLVKFFGTLMLTCAIIAIPMLTCLAITLGWHGCICTMFTLMTVFEAVSIWVEIYDSVDN